MPARHSSGAQKAGFLEDSFMGTRSNFHSNVVPEARPGRLSPSPGPRPRARHLSPLSSALQSGKGSHPAQGTAQGRQRSLVRLHCRQLFREKRATRGCRLSCRPTRMLLGFTTMLVRSAPVGRRAEGPCTDLSRRLQDLLSPICLSTRSFLRALKTRTFCQAGTSWSTKVRSPKLAHLR